MTTISIRYIADGTEKYSNKRENDDFKITVSRREERVRITLRAKRPVTLLGCSFDKPFRYSRTDRIYLNGYQSWTDSREYSCTEHLHNMNHVPESLKDMYHFPMYGDDWFYTYRRGRMHSYTFTYIRHTSGQGAFIGSFNQDNAYLIIEHRKAEREMTLYSDCEHRELKENETFVLYDFIYLKGNVLRNMRDYFSRFGECRADRIRGYTSWYLDYQDINEEKILNALEQMSPDEFDLFQIDDGYETFVGDWHDVDPVKFPNGLGGIVRRIHDRGLQAGIWMAPFVCEVRSRLYAEHPEWVFRVNGKDVYAGSNWSGDVVLDIRRADVRAYIRECLEEYMAAGFDFFKLDFLYAAALIYGPQTPVDEEDEYEEEALPQEEEAAAPDPQTELCVPAEPHILPAEAPQTAAPGGDEGSWYGLTRAGIMRKAMKMLREILGDRLILGCGVPLSSAFNLVDYCRIGPDVSLKFDDEWYMRMMHRERVSTKTTIQNTIWRSFMDGTVFRCDPDVFLLRDDHIGLTRPQKRALVMLNHLCGSVYLTSDQVGKYDEDKKELLAEARRLTGARIRLISQEKNIVIIFYEIDGVNEMLTYDRSRGILI